MSVRKVLAAGLVAALGLGGAVGPAGAATKPLKQSKRIDLPVATGKLYPDDAPIADDAITVP